MDHPMDHPMNAYPQYPQQGYPQLNAAQMNLNQGMGQSMHGGQASMPQPGQYPQQTQAAMGYYGYPMGVQQYMPQYPQQQSSSLLNERFFKGLLIGAAAAYLLTNENVQRTAIKGAVKAWSLLQGGVEELKERFHDAEAEIRTETAE